MGAAPSGPALAANSALTFVFDVTLTAGNFTNYDPDFKINWGGTKNNYDLVSQELAPTDPITTTPLPAALPMFLGGLGVLGMIGRKRKSASKPVAA